MAVDLVSNPQGCCVVFPGIPKIFHLFLGRLVPHGLVCGGPPCSLFVGACASIHERSFWRPLGDQSRFKVRMSNQIWFNTAPRFKWEAVCFWKFLDCFWNVFGSLGTPLIPLLTWKPWNILDILWPFQIPKKSGACPARNWLDICNLKGPDFLEYIRIQYYTIMNMPVQSCATCNTKESGHLAGGK